ncbi:Protein GET1 [Leucoagaricus sp. SymC.cos]|nr:Protein GET1 [Leucoagaricus sp. SymC.cos]
MPSLILTAFLVVLIAQVVSWIGESVLSEYAYALYLRTTNRSLVRKQSQLKSDIMKTKQELSQTSAQDQFAKWAKLRRSVDKNLSELEKLNSKLSSGKTTFTIVFRIFLWILVNIPQYAIAWRYRSKGVFWLPQGWFNPVVTWWLSFPFAPRGSVSVMTWTWACKAVLQIGEETMRYVILPMVISTPVASDEKTDEKKEKAEPIPVAEVD